MQNQPLTLNGRFAHDATTGLSVPNFQGRWSSAVLDVANLVVAQARTTGHARLTVAQLKDIEALKAFGLEGSLVADVTADPNAPAGRLDIVGQGHRPRGPGRGRRHARPQRPCRRSGRPRGRRPDPQRHAPARRRRPFDPEGDGQGRSGERRRRHAAGLRPAAGRRPRRPDRVRGRGDPCRALEVHRPLSRHPARPERADEDRRRRCAHCDRSDQPAGRRRPRRPARGARSAWPATCRSTSPDCRSP